MDLLPSGRPKGFAWQNANAQAWPVLGGGVGDPVQCGPRAELLHLLEKPCLAVENTAQPPRVPHLETAEGPRWIGVLAKNVLCLQENLLCAILRFHVCQHEGLLASVVGNLLRAVVYVSDFLEQLSLLFLLPPCSRGCLL